MSIIINPLLSTVIPTLFTENEKTTKILNDSSARDEAEYLDLAKRSGLKAAKKYKKITKTLADEVAEHGSRIKGTIMAAIANNAVEMEPTSDILSPNRKKAIVTIE